MLDKGSYYSGQANDEKIIFFARRHPLSVLPWFLSLVVLIGIMMIFVSVFSNQLLDLFYSNRQVELQIFNIIPLFYGPSISLLIIIFSGFFLFIMALLLTVWINYYLDVTFIILSIINLLFFNF